MFAAKLSVVVEYEYLSSLVALTFVPCPPALIIRAVDGVVPLFVQYAASPVVQLPHFWSVVVGEEKLEPPAVLPKHPGEPNMVLVREAAGVKLVLIGVEIRRIHEKECSVWRIGDDLLEIAVRDRDSL